MKKLGALFLFVCMLLMSLSVCKAESATDFTSLCFFCTPQEVEAAIQAGADVNTKNKYGRTPLTIAVQAREPEIVSLLLEAGATVSEGDVRLALENERLKDTGVLEELKSRLEK